MPSLYDLLVFAGIAAFAVGVWAVYWPAALILAGLLLVVAGLVGAKLEGQR